MSDDSQKSQTWQVPTSNGGEIQVRCPICGGNHFGSARPPQDESRLGFRHVIAGQLVDFETNAPVGASALPVKFKYCLTCGYILKFMLLQGEVERGSD
jgi:hypothetical protein